jgi:hypothetical protein
VVIGVVSGEQSLPPDEWEERRMKRLLMGTRSGNKWMSAGDSVADSGIRDQRVVQ